MSNKSTALTITQLRGTLVDNKNKLAEMLGQNADVDHYIHGIVEEFEKNPALDTCDASSIIKAVRQLALIGLQAGLPAGQEEAYFVPYAKTCQLLIYYRGMIELARQGGSVKRVITRTIHKGDEGWDYDDGLKPYVTQPRTRALDRSWETMTHVYAHFALAEGQEHLEVMTKSEVEQHKQRYVKAVGKDSPWNKDPLAMARKTVIRRAFSGGQIPMSKRVKQLVLSDNINEVVIDGEVVDTDPDAAVKQLIEGTGMDESGLFDKHEQTT